MSQIYRYEWFAQGMDFKYGFGFNICKTGVYQWFDVPLHARRIDFLVSTEEFEGSVLAHFSEGSSTNWRLVKQDGAKELVLFYERTSNLLREVSNKKIYIGVEY